MLESVSRTSFKDSTFLAQACPIGGEWVTSEAKGIAVINPATGETIAHVPNLGAAETAARSRRRMPPIRRGAPKRRTSARCFCASLRR